MCGITGYYGHKNALPIILSSLKLLEYRGYDSCGLALSINRKIKTVKVVGRVSQLIKKAKKEIKSEAKIGIAHTRWATHGKVNVKNTHPHFDCNKRVAVVHNGIIENFQELKTFLVERGHVFRSDTDTEVIAHLFEHLLNELRDEEKAFIDLIKLLQGSFAILILYNDSLFLARKSSPLVIGLGVKGEFFMASDTIALSKYTNRFIFLDDNDLAIIKDGKLKFLDVNGKKLDKIVQTIEQNEEIISKGNFETFMLKEIFEQPDSVRRMLSGRIHYTKWIPVFGGINFEKIKDFDRIITFACGSSFNAALYGKYLFDKFFPYSAEYASEFKYLDKKITKKDLLIAISQSGETIDVLEALNKYKGKALSTLGIVNVVSSSIARTVDSGIYLHAGREIGVAATKTYVNQLLALYLLWVYFLRKRKIISKKKAEFYLKEALKLPNKIEETLKLNKEIRRLAKKYLHYNNALFLGRKFNYPTALEGALKLKEVSYVHAEALSAGEMKHGPIALIDENLYSVFIVPHDSITDKVVNNMQEIKARKGKIIAVTTKGRKIDMITSLANDVIVVPNTIEELLPILTIIPLQLFAHHTAKLKGLDVDKPRNLAKTVTVE